MKLDLRNHPLILLQDLELLLKNLRRISAENSDVIEVTPEDPDLFRVRESFSGSPFNFRLYNPHLNNHKPSYYFDKTPHSFNSINKYTGSGDRESILNIFKGWINTLREYHKVNLTEDELFEKKTENEFIEYFDIIDEDAETNSFDTEKQIFIDDILDTTIKFLEEKNDPSFAIIIKDANSLKATLHRETKKVTISKLSKIFAKVKKKGIPFFKEFLKELKKESFKKVINWGFDGLGRLIDYVS